MGKGTDNGEIRMDGKGDGYSRIYIYICQYMYIFFDMLIFDGFFK